MNRLSLFRSVVCRPSSAVGLQVLLLIGLSSVVCRLSSAGPIEIPSVSVASLTGAVAVIQAGTSSWNKAATDGVSATGAVAVIQASTGTWNQAATDGASWTNAQTAAVKSVTNVLTTTNNVTWYVVFSSAGLITHFSTNAP